MALEKDQASLFEDSFLINDCDREWKDMPEFVQKKQTIYRALTINFKNQ